MTRSPAHWPRAMVCSFVPGLAHPFPAWRLTVCKQLCRPREGRSKPKLFSHQHIKEKFGHWEIWDGRGNGDLLRAGDRAGSPRLGERRKQTVDELLGQNMPKCFRKKELKGREVMALGDGLLSLLRGWSSPEL